MHFQGKIDTEVFNTVITSPPYNIGKEYESVQPLSDYVRWSIDWINGASRLLVEDEALDPSRVILHFVKRRMRLALQGFTYSASGIFKRLQCNEGCRELP